MQLCSIKQHSRSEIHRLAVESYYRRDFAPQPWKWKDRTSSFSRAPCRSCQTLCGNSAWVLNPTSFKSMQALSLTEAFLSRRSDAACLSQERRDHKSRTVVAFMIPFQEISRKAAASMVQVMAEVVRLKKVSALAQPKFVTLTFDDRSPRTVLKYRCSLPDMLIVFVPAGTLRLQNACLGATQVMSQAMAAMVW